MADLKRVRQIAEAVRAAGGRAIVFGGWVRDRLLGRACKDLDLEVYGGLIERVEIGVVEGVVAEGVATGPLGRLI